MAGFIGSNLLEALLELDQKVIGLDNFATGYRRNLKEVEEKVSSSQWKRFSLIEGNIANYENCIEAVKNVDFVLHQAALGSVPRSILNPRQTHDANATGFLNILHASKEEGVASFTYAASSSTYGDSKILPKVEDNIGNPLSPYAVTKYVNELYASVYSKNFNFNSIGLRYFNVFGKRQDPNSQYSAVIPSWISSLIKGENIFINGDGESSRDFCFIENIVQINLLAATAADNALNEVYNVALGDKTTLNDLYLAIKLALEEKGLETKTKPFYREFRPGDIRHSQADINKAIVKLGYEPKYRILDGIKQTIPWYIDLLEYSKRDP